MKKSERGQAVLIVLLLMAVILTIGLSVVSRSVTDIKISQQEEESARALSAAEAGIEEALRSGIGVGRTVGSGNAQVTTYVTKMSVGGGMDFNFGGGRFPPGDTQTFWLASHDAGGNLISGWKDNTLQLHWGNYPTDPDPKPALEAILYYKHGPTGEIRSARWCFDRDASSRLNGCTDSEAGPKFVVNGVDYSYKAILNGLNGLVGVNQGGFPYFLRLKFIYNDVPQILAMKIPNGNFAIQGNCYESTATVAQSGITRKVKQCEYYKAPPAIFDYTLFSEHNLEASP